MAITYRFFAEGFDSPKCSSLIRGEPSAGFEKMRKLRVFFYIDSGTMTSHCVAAAELIRKNLDAHIIMMMVDSGKHLTEGMKNYEILDYKDLYFRRGFLKWELMTLVRAFLVSRKGSSQDASQVATPDNLWRKILRAAAGVVWAPFAFCAMCVARLAGAARTRLLLASGAAWCRRSRAAGKVHGALLQVYVRTRGAYEALHNTIAARTAYSAWRIFFGVYGVYRILRETHPDVIIVPEDNIETFSSIFVAAGRKIGVPSIVIPFTIPNPAEPARYYFENPFFEARGPLASILTTFRPNWRFSYNGKNLLRLPATRAIARELAGLSSPAPWILNRGFAAAIALDSEFQRDLYLRLGFPPDQLRVIGDLNGEVFSRSIEQRSNLIQEFCTRYGWRADRPLIVCGFPPSQYDGLSSTGFEFPCYSDLVHAWVGAFKSLGDKANVLISPHPRISIALFDGLEGTNLRVVSGRTAELIPLCDLYVASISATIRWAIACGIPVINYDTYRYRYGDYVSASGVMHVENLADFRELLTRFVSDPDFAAAAGQRQRADMMHWGRLDDGVGQRLARLVLDVTATSGEGDDGEERSLGG